MTTTTDHAEIIRLVRQEWMRVPTWDLSNDWVRVVTNEGIHLILVNWYEVMSGPRQGLTYCRYVRAWELNEFPGDSG